MRQQALAFAFLASSIAGISAGCGSSDQARTQLMVLVNAEPGVAADTASLRVEVESGTSLTDLDAIFGDVVRRPIAWPVRIALVPRGNDPRRPFRVRVAALDASGREVVTTRILTSYVPGRTKLLELLLEESCRGVECRESERCRTAVCIDEYVDPNELEDLATDGLDGGGAGDGGNSDGGRLDGSLEDGGIQDGGIDAGGSGDGGTELDSGMDASTGVDAATDGGSDAGACTGGQIDCGSGCQTPNACGGCSILPGQPNAQCGTCSYYACDGTEALMCVGECPDGGVGFDGGVLPDGGVVIDDSGVFDAL